MKNPPITVILATLALFLAEFGLSSRIRAIEPDWKEPPASRMRGLNPEVFRVLTFGQTPAAIDWLLIRSLVNDVSVAPVTRGTHPSAYYDLDLATDLDPAFFQMYALGANSLAVIRSDGAGAAALYMKAKRFQDELLPTYPAEFRSRFWSSEWRIPLLQAYVYLFELDDMPSAAKAFRAAAAYPDVPPYTKVLARRFEKDDGAYEVGLRLLIAMIRVSTSEAATQKLERRRSNLELQHFMYVVNRDFATFRSSPGNRSGSWDAFIRARGIDPRDPRGGALTLDPVAGRIVTSTPYEKVMGLP